MNQRLFLTAVLVRDYDAAMAFYVGKLGFEVRRDDRISPGKRWIVLAPAGGGQGGILLAKAENDRQSAAIGNQTGGRVFLFLETDSFHRDHAAYRANGVRFVEDPRSEEYGIVAVFEDLYGNRWDLIEHNAVSATSPDEPASR